MIEHRSELKLEMIHLRLFEVEAAFLAAVVMVGLGFHSLHSEKIDMQLCHHFEGSHTK
jgi:hypothetical protein